MEQTHAKGHNTCSACTCISAAVQQQVVAFIRVLVKLCSRIIYTRASACVYSVSYR